MDLSCEVEGAKGLADAVREATAGLDGAERLVEVAEWLASASARSTLRKAIDRSKAIAAAPDRYGYERATKWILVASLVTLLSIAADAAADAAGTMAEQPEGQGG